MNSVRSYPPTQPPVITNFTPRSRTEPLPGAGGFMRSVMRRHELDDLGEDLLMLSQPEKQISQEEQNELDEKARKRAMKNLVSSWQERLQLISVITTFFATTEAAMLVNTKPTASDNLASGVLKASNACLLGALIVHVYAAILSFLGAFLLIRYKLKEATREEMLAEGIKWSTSPVGGSVNRDIERSTADLGQRTLTDYGIPPPTHKANGGTTTWAPGLDKRKGSYPLEPPIISSNPHLEQVGLFVSNSSHLLSRTHTLCVSLAAVGFVLAIVGILCYAWYAQPIEVSIFSSACLGGAILAMAVLFIP